MVDYLRFVVRCWLKTVFIDPVGVEVAFGILAVTATIAVEGLIAGVVECSLAGVDFRLAIGLRASGGIPDGDPLRIALETSSHNSRSFPRRFPKGRRFIFAFHHRAIFRGDLSPESGGRSADSQMREGSGRQDVPEIPSC
jgi:hypothetical protein